MDDAGVVSKAAIEAWETKEGDFTWYKLEIKDVLYNQKGNIP
jgi:hypothetical protein